MISERQERSLRAQILEATSEVEKMKHRLTSLEIDNIALWTLVKKLDFKPGMSQ